MIVKFTRINGKYISDIGLEITTETLMDNQHEINGDFGWVIINESEPTDNIIYCTDIKK